MKHKKGRLNLTKGKEPTKAEILAGIKQGFKEAMLIIAGKMKGRPIQELLDEL